MYSKLKTDYEKTFIQKIDFRIRQIVGQWEQNAFWYARRVNTEKLRAEINDEL